ncbi:hypothetical protein L1987_63606 [Smallanthus sonchifolius]|uniref:Uncharacterized protein n=1 Tax=Smallanthus sonchifolius TaxID=185202 RepID=A0ACB9CDR6_9ASTR|nr:hypothetical protein L1987_63606 [Smallanthus sonchifolius]
MRQSRWCAGLPPRKEPGRKMAKEQLEAKEHGSQGRWPRLGAAETGGDRGGCGGCHECAKRRRRLLWRCTWWTVVAGMVLLDKEDDPMFG